MIAVEGDAVAHLGGWRGDQLRLSRGAGAFRLLAELGWDRAAQSAPQRRLLLAGGEIFLLEPVTGPLLRPPLRVRRFDFGGVEVGREEGEGEPGEADLSYHARREGPHRWRVCRCGIDAGRGRPTVLEETIAAELTGRPSWEETSGTPLGLGGVCWYPVRHRGLFGVAHDRTVRRLEGDPAPPQALGGRLVCAANRKGRPGLWVDHAWRRLAGNSLFPAWRAPPGPLVAVHGEGGYLALRREGGDLPVLDGPAARLPPGIYSSLLAVDRRLFAVAEAAEPRLIPVTG